MSPLFGSPYSDKPWTISLVIAACVDDATGTRARTIVLSNWSAGHYMSVAMYLSTCFPYTQGLAKLVSGCTGTIGIYNDSAHRSIVPTPQGSYTLAYTE